MQKKRRTLKIQRIKETKRNRKVKKRNKKKMGKR